MTKPGNNPEMILSSLLNGLNAVRNSADCIDIIHKDEDWECPWVMQVQLMFLIIGQKLFFSYIRIKN